MARPFLRRWARLSIPIAMLLVGLAFRLAGVLPGWSTLLILGGLIAGALVAYVILLGEHERTMVTDRGTEESNLAIDKKLGLRHPIRGEWDAGYDGR